MFDRFRPKTGAIHPLILALGLGLAIIALSTAAPFFRQAAPTHPMAAAALRLAAAFVLLLPFLLRAWRAGRTNHRFWVHALAAGGFYALHFGTWVTSLTMTSVAASVTLVTATPLILAVWAVLHKTDVPSRRTWMALAISGLGMVVIGGHDLGISTTHFLGDFLAMAGAFSMAAYLLVARRLGKDLDVLAFMAVATGCGAAVLYAACFAIGVDPAPASHGALIFLLLAALVPQLIGHNLLTWALRHTTPTTVGIATVGEPVGATILAWIWLGESVSPVIIFGGCLTISGVILAITAGANRATRASPSADGEP